MSKASSKSKYSWTHPSVISFAGAADPIEVIEKHARIVALNAIDSGWAGPPFDPILLAEKLK